ncbi:MAG TPA: cytochrome C biogenesis protein [Bacteroidales bacterium]|nr:cytochrome C biogenesis protein [Bacteroidales bacterium]
MMKFFKFLASPMLMALLIIAFGVSSAMATFIENDFGTEAARAIVYNAWWFESIMLLLVLNFLASIFTRKLFKKGKVAVMLFHLGFVVILIGSAITRYYGQEGMMHIRKGETATWFSSAEKWISIYNDEELIDSDKVMLTPVSRNRYNNTVKFNGDRLEIELTDLIPHAVETVVGHFDGYPVVSLFVVSAIQNTPVLVRPNHPVSIDNVSIGFASDGNKYEVALKLVDSQIQLQSTLPIITSQMEDGVEEELHLDDSVRLKPKVFYQIGRTQFAYRGHWESAIVKMVYNPDPNIGGTDVIALSAKYKGNERNIYVPLSNVSDNPVYENFEGKMVGFKYGPKRIEIPFGVKLQDFILERYPGSDSPSSFTSNVVVVDKQNNLEKPFSIFMNNILNYKGYRFYQSSYDDDEKGTFLSVNKDLLGTSISYLGYFILVVGILWALVSRGSRFRKLISKPASAVIILLMLLGSVPLFAQNNAPEVNREHAREFSSLLIQDKGGRMKPVSTLASEVLRKLNRSTKLNGQSPEQVYLGMSVYPDFWQHTPIIKIKGKELSRVLGVRDNMVAFVDFFDHQVDGSYKLRRLVQEAFAQKPAQRTALQKEVIKADEKVNVLYMVFTGQMARIFPIPEHTENRWLSMDEVSKKSDSTNVFSFGDVYSNYILSVRNATKSGNWNQPKELLSELKAIQQQYGGSIIPPESKIRAEVISNRLLIFERLIPFYGLTGLVLLIIVFTEMFYKGNLGKRIFTVLAAVLILGFVAQTFAIGLRWYIAGRAPLSNGFESLVYVSWAAMLAGFMFAKRSRVVLPATALLSTLILFVAHLSWMDPEITNLVPVLKSYWLTIHVAVITASYGFFGLGAILGLFNIFLYAFQTKNNFTSIDKHIKSITVINELNLTLGLYLLTIGSFLGAVWANESWGRYWGWDPKETWALITILVYAFVLHMRLIPSFKSTFALNFGSLIGIGSVLMTYFGVNYYLSGLHSYAGGDAVPVPRWLFFVVAGFLSLSFFAWYNNRMIVADAENPKESRTE